MTENITRLFDFAYHQFETNPTHKCFYTKVKGNWVATTMQHYLEQANAISRALLRLNVKPNDKIAIISSTNRTEWNIIDIAVQQIGAQTVPMYPSISAKEYEYIFNHAEIKLCFLSDEELYQKVKIATENSITLKDIYAFEEIDGCKNWRDLLEIGADPSNQSEVEISKNKVKPTDLVTIIYTSGTTGVPKGVMLSHQGLVRNILAAVDFLPKFSPNAPVLSFLPVCHSLERCAIYMYQYLGLTVYYGEGIDKIGDNIKEIKPETMTVVPRLVEKIYDKIYAKGLELTGIKKKLFYWAIELGNNYELNRRNSIWYYMQLILARKIIFNKWKAALGGRLDYLICGSAALQPRLIKMFGAAGIQIIEGYGLTESPIVAANNYNNGLVKFGTVGTAIEGIQISIAQDGEILVRGNNLMLGYFKNPEITDEVLKNGVFHTGDKGEIDSEGFLKITGRKKEIFKTSGGKYISPVLIENQLKQSRFIEEVMVVGENEKMPAAIIQPNFDLLKNWIRKKQLGTDLSRQELK